jgi:hypothetical protein
MQDDSTVLPKEVEARVTGGKLHILGQVIPLPIKGKGSFTIVYLDDALRIFQSPNGSIVAQVRADRLKKQ